MPTQLTYGGNYFNLSMTASDVNGKPDSIKVVIMRFGFSTHAMVCCLARRIVLV